jgi:propionyl-CoA carboxylase beta chain
LTARERLDALLDPGSLRELGLLAYSDRPDVAEAAPADAVITGVGCVAGRRVAVLALDPTVLRGSHGRIAIRKTAHIHYLAHTKGIPLVVLGEGSGGRVPDLLDATFPELGGNHAGDDAFGFRHDRVRIPKATAILGACYGDPAFLAAISDLVVMSGGSSMGIAGPSVIRGATSLEITNEELAGYDVAGKVSGLAHIQTEDELDAIKTLKSFLSYLPSNASLDAPILDDWAPPATDPAGLREIVPDQFNRAYDARNVIDAICDQASFLEIRRDWGRTLVGGLARIEGRPIAIAANQSMRLAGAIDNDGIQKLTDLVDLADGFGLPIVCLVDIPGLMIGPEVERQGIGKTAMALLRRLNACTVPRVTVVLRKAYGFGWSLMGGYPSGADYVVAWPNAEIGFMAPASAVPVLYRRELEEAAAESVERRKAVARSLESGLSGEYAPWSAAGRTSLHDVIRPENTRQAILDGIFIGTSEIARNERPTGSTR